MLLSETAFRARATRVAISTLIACVVALMTLIFHASPYVAIFVGGIGGGAAIVIVAALQEAHISVGF